MPKQDRSFLKPLRHEDGEEGNGHEEVEKVEDAKSARRARFPSCHKVRHASTIRLNSVVWVSVTKLPSGQLAFSQP
jgi:hypothetical protein